MGFLSDLFGGKKKQAIIDALESGAKIIDVRTPGEFQSGNVNGSVNIPLNKLNDKSVKRIKNLRVPVVVCCASGSRSRVARGILTGAGIDAINGGSWYKVHRLMAE